MKWQDGIKCFPGIPAVKISCTILAVTPDVTEKETLVKKQCYRHWYAVTNVLVNNLIHTAFDTMLLSAFSPKILLHSKVYCFGLFE